MNTLNFVLTVVLVTASGALAPGPLFFATISHGARSGAKSGLVFSVAHTAVEFTLIMLFALGLLTVASKPMVKLVVGITGGIMLVVFGLIQIRNSFGSEFGKPNPRASSSRHLFLVGLAFTGLNPYFILWWLTVGAQLIIMALEFAALPGVLFMYFCHVWMDYAWLISVAHFARKGMNILGSRKYKVLMAAFGAVLIYFGITFFVNALT